MHGQAKFAAAWRSLLITPVLFGIVNSSSAAETGDLPELRSKALEVVNEAREQHGLPPLQSRPELDRAAQAHAEDMLNRNYFDHVSPEEKTVFDRYVAAGRESLATGCREYRQVCDVQGTAADQRRHTIAGRLDAKRYASRKHSEPRRDTVWLRHGHGGR